jgi:hypothetical protein
LIDRIKPPTEKSYSFWATNVKIPKKVIIPQIDFYFFFFAASDAFVCTKQKKTKNMKFPD